LFGCWDAIVSIFLFDWMNEVGWNNPITCLDRGQQWDREYGDPPGEITPPIVYSSTRLILMVNQACNFQTILNFIRMHDWKQN
jgi:hypothetical protein